MHQTRLKISKAYHFLLRVSSQAEELGTYIYSLQRLRNFNEKHFSAYWIFTLHISIIMDHDSLPLTLNLCLYNVYR